MSEIEEWPKDRLVREIDHAAIVALLLSLEPLESIDRLHRIAESVEP